MDAFWILLVGSLVAVSCALVGSFLVLRRMALMADAISHAVLPGIVVAFLVSGSRSTLPMLLGAGAVGMLTTLIIEFLHSRARLQTDASIGLTFTALFALGVVLLTVFAGQVDLDQDCVLYGEIAYVPLDLVALADGTTLGPRAVWVLGAVLLIVILFIVIVYKELQLTTFDPGYAVAIGFSTAAWHYALMALTSLVTVASFESVGAILVVALMVAPAATARLLTHRLPLMLVLAAGFGITATVLGYMLAVWVDGAIAGAIATVAGAQFVLVLLLSPTQSLFKYRLRTRMEATQ